MNKAKKMKTPRGEEPSPSPEPSPPEEKKIDHPTFTDEQWTALSEQFNLTRVELEVLKLILQGEGRQEIASARCRSVKTIDVHYSSLFKKFGVHRVSELIQVALSNLQKADEKD